MNRLRSAGMALMMLCGIVALPAAAADRLVLSSGMRAPWTTPEGTGFTNLFIAELFHRIGIDATVTFNAAAARALPLADDGTDDGLAARIAGLESQYPNLVRVPEPIFHNDFIALSLSDTSPVHNWDDLRPHSVGYILGWQVFDLNLPPVRELTQAKDSPQLMGLLKAGRIEVALHERWQARWQAREMAMTVAEHQPPLASVPMYIYLNRRHAALAPRLANELRAMKAEGRPQAIMAEVFARQPPPP